MKKIRSNDSGFTLVELVVALAILAFLMAMVTGLMGMNTITYRKTKADISVQTTAQDTYNIIADAVMQAKSIEIEGYVLDADPAFEYNNVGKAYTGNATQVKVVKKATVATDTLFSDVSGSKIYPTKITIVYAEVIEAKYVNNIDKNSLMSTYGVTSVDGLKDECTLEITFDGNKMYAKRTYKYMTYKNGVYANLEDTLYTSSLNYVVSTSGKKISAFDITPNAESNSLGFTLKFSDKDSRYETEGVVNIKNSYVLREAK